MPKFFDPTIGEAGLWVLAICLISGLYCFNRWLLNELQFSKFKAYRLVICLGLSLLYLILMVALMLVATLVIACSFGDCL